MNEKYFAIRTVRNGRIRLAGQDWEPDDRSFPYDGRLDGRRMAFGRYPGYDRPVLALWGTEGAYRCLACGTEECSDPDHWPGPHCIDGVFHWAWWRPVGSVPEHGQEAA